MKKCLLGKSDLVINTLIAINERESRRVIDTIDVTLYYQELTKKASEMGVQIEIDSKDSNFSFMEQSIYCLNAEQTSFFGIYPWISASSLYDSRENLSFDLCAVISNIDLTSISYRKSQSLDTLNHIDDVVSSSYLKDLMSQQTKIKQKIDDIYKNRRRTN